MSSTAGSPSRRGSECMHSCSRTQELKWKAFLSWADEYYVRPHHRSAELLDPANIDTPRIDWSAPS